jgi:hypothetical protein
MKIVRKSPFSGKTNEMEIPVTPEQLDQWHNGELIQKAMPNLTPDQREFIMTGITPEEWAETFGDER